MAESTTDKNKTQGASQPQQKKSGRSGGNRRPRQGQGRPAKKATPAQAAKAQEQAQAGAAKQPAQQKQAPQKKQAAAAKQPAQGGQRRPSSRSRQPKKATPAQAAKTAAAAQSAALAPAAAPQPQAEGKKKAPFGGRKKSGSGKKGGALPLRIVPLGGLHEVGKNCTAVEYGEDIVVIDCGLTFPDSDMPGVDIVIPDFTYLIENKKRIRGVVLTHGHEDHIGGLPYLLKEISVPLYGTRLTLGLVEGKLEEHRLLEKSKLNVVAAGDRVQLGRMQVEFIRVNHSIPGAVALAFHTPAGTLVHTGDFKIDYDPIDGEMIDLARFAELGKEGVTALLMDSTNAERPGMTASERSVGRSFENLFAKAGNRRIIIASFASNIHRIQQIIDTAHKFRRKVLVSGRSMENVTARAIELGYLKVPKGQLIELAEAGDYPPEKLVVITTGSQGEPMAALSRMANGTHRQLSVNSRDFIIISARPIPGNEKHVGNVVNALFKLGAEVIYESMYEVHVSGHACQGELKTILALTKPQYFMPVHGEYRHLIKNAGLGRSLGIPEKNIVISENGRVVEFGPRGVKKDELVTAGKVMVDGLGVGDVGSIVLRDRKRLSEDGLLTIVITIDSETSEVVAGPDIVTRGFVYVRESEQLIKEARAVVTKTLDKCLEREVNDWADLKLNIREALSMFLFQKTKRSPMILPIIMEV
ncbi:ribonuclease J [Bittarella massiliensis (ex Durand et al. 2017)]|uniref:Ribonuclease J n=1 Tax=Bittarella massiliensis (ex Durand et al. 2017) TaxID=1720313 RepID=A0AAW5KD37_9FIRM|nr:ribonuclease J [Bittarella massiliensis (ex Durand et al. 2017)]MCQ4950433.1 ribonuclease J [Bittarella massiliensis (ex Durand et al. 2017)]